MLEPEVRKINPRVFVIVVVFLLSLTLTGWQLVAHQYRPVDANDSTIIEVRIPDNSSAREVASLLRQNGLIRSEKIFLAYCRQKGMDKQLKAGLYDLSKSQTLPQLALQISSGRVKSTNFTVPEGFTVKQIGELLVNKQLCTQEQWDKAVLIKYSYGFIPAGISSQDKRRLEGFLFPETYTIEKETSAENIVNMMLGRFNSVWTEQFANQAQARQISVRDTIIIASLIEREARVPEERARIAGVIYNRLQKGMPLQIDATVLYSLGEHRETLTYKDLEIDSPYNTYKNAGLPYGPIACPGRAAIEAALNPEKNDYYYYVSKGDNTHYFSTNYAEHLEAIRKYGL